MGIREISQRIHLIRGQRVVLDTDLAAFYGETTKRFNQQVSRNQARFPEDEESCEVVRCAGARDR